MKNQLLTSLKVSTWDPPVSACDQEKYICAVIFSSKRHFFGEKRRFFKRRMHGLAVETFLLAPFLRGAAEINETNWVETGSEQHSTQREMAETFWGVNDYLFFMQVGWKRLLKGFGPLSPFKWGTSHLKQCIRDQMSQPWFCFPEKVAAI